MKNLLIIFSFFTIVSYGQSKCYLEYHMRTGVQVRDYCWGNNSKKFLDTLSKEAHHYLDSVFKKFRIDANTVVCKKIKLNESSRFINKDLLTNSNYFFSVFERTFDCFDSWDFKNYKGRFKVRKETKIYLEYSIGVLGNYEMLKIYIINDKDQPDLISQI